MPKITFENKNLIFRENKIPFYFGKCLDFANDPKDTNQAFSTISHFCENAAENLTTFEEFFRHFSPFSKIYFV